MHPPKSTGTLLAIVIANQGGASFMAPRREQPSIARELLTSGVFRLKPL
jgi:hypothetical protein